MNGRTIRIYLVDGVPSGILTAEIMNWTGKVIVSPRSQNEAACERANRGQRVTALLYGQSRNIRNGPGN